MIFEQCKVGRYFAWAGSDPGIKSPVIVYKGSPLLLVLITIKIPAHRCLLLGANRHQLLQHLLPVSFILVVDRPQWPNL